MRSFFEELRRRNVLRAGALYIAGAWALAQGIAQLGPAFGMPDWGTRWFVIAGVTGFPFWIAFAWFYEFTPEGLKRESDIDPAQSITAHTGKKLDRWIIGVLAIAVVLLLTDRFVLRSASKDDSPAMAAVSDKSVAVLPFENLSADKDNEYFVVGMQDEILTRLANLGQLKVISRTSTEKYKSRPEDLRTVGQELGVANLVEGSVQRAGDKVRITVQLIDARTDTHLWAQTYDRQLQDVFAVQSDVAGQIAGALKLTLIPAEAAAIAQRPTSDTTAYDLFLRAEYLANKGGMNFDPVFLKQSIEFYGKAVVQDPMFPLALARLSYAQSLLAWLGGPDIDANDLNARARANAERALALQPELADAHLAAGFSSYYGRQEYDAALKEFAAALRLRPNDASAMAATAYVLRRQGQFDASLEQLETALARDPRNTRIAMNLGSTYSMLRRYRDAERQFERAVSIDPDNFNARAQLAVAILYGSGDFARALAATPGDDPRMKLARISTFAYQRRFEEAIALLESVEDSPDTFNDFGYQSKDLMLGDFYRQAGDLARARPLFERAATILRARAGALGGVPTKLPWTLIAWADAELGLGHVDTALAMMARAQDLMARSGDHLYGPSLAQSNAILYAQASRADLAVPLIDEAIRAPGSGTVYSPLMLWLDPAWDPIRNDPLFDALLVKYPKGPPRQG